MLKAGAILAISGAAVMGGYGLYYGFKEEVFESSIPLVIRVAVPATCIGVGEVPKAQGRESWGGAGMMVVTTDEIEGRRITSVLGLVRGNTVRARHMGRDILAGLRTVVGGEVKEYTRLLAESREQAAQRMMQRAEELGANAVVGTRFMTSAIMGEASEILAYGTAVVVEER